MSKTMGTVDKALILLEFFTVADPEWGLSELAREAGHDKTTTLRLLNSLMRGGFVEQHPKTKKFRIGTTVLKLARVREASFPFVTVIQPSLENLAEATGETAHASVPNGEALTTVSIVAPQRATRVYVDPSQPLPYHATASGLAYLAFAKDEAVEAALSAGELRAHTQHTVIDPKELRSELVRIRERGYAISAKSFELETIGIACPIFDWTGFASATVAVACVASRITASLEARVAAAVTEAAVDITRALGAVPPSGFLETHKGPAA
ncbi:IclR family transcriptional regulator [Mesorhizobium sp. WSM4976]|uniref:IclR family transcriptional regulator n=1 Tax=Mesorhizobium sp. WSM4976 TaxID=3038549 RepID=UPI002415B973|nr:IclR family transcriptional regulator [Mesorhizobium sp. WSM4976]MDG4897629.1 IclR family transcriptional regulator [Mesorhizobium sp. WSM4976]